MPGSVVFQHPVKHSLRLALSLLVLHMIAAAVMLVTALPWPAKLATLVLIILSLAYYLARDVLLLLGDSWCDISFCQKDVSVVKRDGTAFRGHVANMTFVCPCFVVLCLKPEGKRTLVSRMIFPDAIGAGAFREVRVHLRYS
jgi:toxin CptA